MNKIFPLNFTFAFSLSVFLLFSSCVYAQKPKPDKGKGGKGNTVFIYGNAAQDDASYSHIVNNVARLKAMLTGKFVQYNTAGDTTGTKYSVWRVNDGKDSVVIYQVPVGNFQKIGHWMYQCQVMTSLPDNPIYQAFTKLVEVNRDTIQEFYYAAPSDFEMSMEQLLENPEELFTNINFNELKPMDDPETVTYVRQSPLHFIGNSSLTVVPQNKSFFKMIVYEIKPQKVRMRFDIFDANKNRLGAQGPPDHLNKLAMMKSDAPK